MSSTIPYFYGKNATDNFSHSLPPQCLPESQKTTRWKELTMDCLERIGLCQLHDNAKYSDFYKMIKGELVFSDFTDLPAQLSELEGLMEEFNLPTFLKHYDLIGIILNAMVGQYKKMSDKFVAVSNDEIATNEFKRRKQDLINNYIKEEIDKEIEIRLIEEGLDPTRQEFSSPEEQQAYIDEIRQRRQQLAPADIERHMANDYSTNFVRWANLTLEQDAERYNFSDLDRLNLIDFLLTGRCFRHYRIGWDFYKPEHWSPLNTFFSQDLETRYVQNGEYVGRVHFYTPSQVLNMYGSQLSEKQQKKLLNGNSTLVNGAPEKGTSYKRLFESNFSAGSIVPHEQHADYNFALQIQDLTGNPIGETTVIDKEGNSVKVPRYLPHRNTEGSFSPNLTYARQIRDDLKIRTDLLQVTEAYWEGYKRVAQLTFRMPDTGRIEIATVTEDLLEDFIKENEIKKLTNISIEEHEKKSLEDRVNTIVYTYIPITYEGVKISMYNRDVSEDIYLKCTPMDLQLKGDSNVYDNKRPVSGIVDASLANILRPYQIGYNLSMNEVQNLSEKEIGMLYMFDMAMLPAEYRNFGDSVDEVLNNLVNVARRTGFMPFDSNRQNTQAASGNIPFQAQNLSLTPQIQNAIYKAQMYKQAAFEQIGINPGMLGAPTKYETAEGVQVSQDASYAQIERYFDIFGEFKKQALEMHLNVAQYSKKNNKDITVFYTSSDMTTALLEFTDDNFYARKLHIYPTSNSKKRRELQDFKSFIINTNTLADDTLALAEFITADTTQEVLAIAKSSLQRRAENDQVTHERQMEQIQANVQTQDELNQRNWDRQEVSKNRDRLVDIQVAEIGKAGKESNTNFQKDLFSKSVQISSAIDKQNNTQYQLNLQQQEVDRKRLKDETDEDYRHRILEFKERELAVREKAIDAKTLGDKINKN